LTSAAGVGQDRRIEHVDVAGLRIAFHRGGRGDPIVFLHGGFGLDHRSWAPQLRSFADEFSVIAWDGPGTGESSDPPEDFRMAEFADCLADFLAAAAVERAHVVGLSAGATLALELCRRHRSIPRSLVLAGAYAGWAGSLPPEEVERRLAAYLAQVERPASEWIGDYLPTLVSPNASPEVRAELLGLLEEIRPQSSAVLLKSMAECDQRDMLGSITVPTLLLYGELDVRSPVAVGEELHDEIVGAQLVVIPDVGHVCNLEAPAEFDRAVRTFLATVA
jgi:pimeloyl-ACP methyl ester carboxylesterase